MQISHKVRRKEGDVKPALPWIAGPPEGGRYEGERAADPSLKAFRVKDESGHLWLMSYYYQLRS